MILKNAENALVRDQLEELISQARRNEHALRQFQALETGLLSINSLRDLIERAIEDTRETFELERVTLALVDEQNKLGHFLRDDGLNIDTLDGLILLDSPFILEQTFGRDIRPHLGPYLDDRCAAFFPEPPSSNSSIALLPMFRHGKFLGCLNLASRDQKRFSGQMATDFLDHLSSILGVCLENTLSFELLRYTSLIDMLTGVNNRHFFNQRITEEIGRATRTGELLSCLFLDIDHFKNINDTHGHACGDLVLVEVARVIRALLRVNDLLARYGGEEFVALLTITHAHESILIAERIRHHIEHRELTSINGEPIRISISIGVASLDPASTHADPRSIEKNLIGLADHALYQAKGGGRNRVVDGGFLHEDAFTRELAEIP